MAEDLFQPKTLNTEWRFIHPCRILLSGVTMAGKSRTIMKFIEYQNYVFNTIFERIIYAVPSTAFSYLHENDINKLRQHCHNIEICKGFPIFGELFHESNKHLKTLLIMEEFLTQGNFANDPLSLDLLTAKSHHLNFSLIITCQNYYFEGKYAPHIRKQFTDVVLFRNRGNKQDLLTLNKQIFPGFTNYLNLCFQFIHDHCNDNEQFLIIDKGPLSKMPEQFQVRCNILPKNNLIEPIFLCPKRSSQ